MNHDSFGLYLGLSWYVAWTHITICQKHGFKSVVEDNPLSPHTGQKKQNIFVSLHLFWNELWLNCCLTHQWKPGNRLRSFGSIIKEMNTRNHSLCEKRDNIIGLCYLCGSRGHLLQRIIVCKSFVHGNKPLSQTRAKTLILVGS